MSKTMISVDNEISVFKAIYLFNIKTLVRIMFLSEDRIPSVPLL